MVIVRAASNHTPEIFNHSNRQISTSLTDDDDDDDDDDDESFI